MDKGFMLAAIEEAMHSQEPIPCGVVVVKGKKVISKAHNNQRRTFNASSHAEINAIRRAGKKLNNKNLVGCTIYCTCEPCTMCLSALMFAKIDRLVYGVSLKQISPKDLTIDIDLDYFLKNSKHKLKVTKNFMQKECMDIYANPK